VLCGALFFLSVGVTANARADDFSAGGFDQRSAHGPFFPPTILWSAQSQFAPVPGVVAEREARHAAKMSKTKKETAMGAPSPELCNLWLARAFNAQDVEAAAAMYHPDASIVQVDQVHGGTRTARGAEGIRETMAAYIGMKPHMDVVTHHTTVAGDFAMTRSQWLIKGQDKDGKPTEVHHHGMEVHRKLPDGTWVFFIDHPFGADPFWAVAAPPSGA
jgi:ketosteroid isomerase-like protein